MFYSLLKVDVQVSNYYCWIVYFSFQFCQFLLHVFWCSTVRCICIFFPPEHRLCFLLRSDLTCLSLHFLICNMGNLMEIPADDIFCPLTPTWLDQQLELWLLKQGAFLRRLCPKSICAYSWKHYRGSSLNPGQTRQAQLSD